MASMTAELRTAMAELETPAGANRPYHNVTSYPGRPASAMVGIVGAAEERFAVVTAIAFTFPAATSGNTGGKPEMYS